MNSAGTDGGWTQYGAVPPKGAVLRDTLERWLRDTQLARRTIEDREERGLAAIEGQLDLLQHLSSTRGNGLKAMVKRIQDRARQTN